MPELTLTFDDADGLEAELSTHLGHGRAFVPGAVHVEERTHCTLVLVHPEGGATLELEAEVVWVKCDAPGAGVGLEILGFDEATKRSLEVFAAGPKQQGESAAAAHVHARVRHYNAAEQLRAARQGDHAERIALEQVYGKAVWDVLLRNPRITPPEVTRLARNPKLPKHLIDVITGNAGWLASSGLRRSLLMNPQLGGAAMDKVLRATPPAELTRVARQAVFPSKVREAAKRLQER